LRAIRRQRHESIPEQWSENKALPSCVFDILRDQVDCIVSGDLDLLDLHPFQNIPILTTARIETP
jgi:predicted nucleic acid-binding protein